MGLRAAAAARAADRARPRAPGRDARACAVSAARCRQAPADGGLRCGAARLAGDAAGGRAGGRAGWRRPEKNERLHALGDEGDVEGGDDGRGAEGCARREEKPHVVRLARERVALGREARGRCGRERVRAVECHDEEQPPGYRMQLAGG